jgi:hypothetical protein
LVGLAKGIVEREEVYIDKGAKGHARLQRIREGNESSKFFFDFLKKMVVVNQSAYDGSLKEDPSKIQGMFRGHFRNIFSPYPLTKTVVVVRNVSYRVVSNKVFVVDYDRLGRNFTKEELFPAISSMQNVKYPSHDGVPVSSTRLCGILLLMISST